MQAIDPFLAASVFGVTILLDGLHVIYTRAVTQGQAVRAANFGSIMYFLGGYMVLQYTSNPFYLLFVVLGSWVGVYGSVRLALAMEEGKKKAAEETPAALISEAEAIKQPS